ncbi:WXG100 family type VII secretion target [Micromonospora pisi]|uniref:WXG100 family type VII secretion target n=1 Tax=Micromonospora pisi TaxID=589240 RepID=A0A495JDC8_9ACTN|nr:WXG100 family type VII secretion target [Micromonospora pisi]RKR86741.1 WXG100 family type VII secretion target [Micromonospora pisi]
MTQPRIISDDETRTSLINGFSQTVQDLEAAERTVLTSSAELGATWIGDASRRYQEGIQEISQGIVNIRSALNSLSDDMQRFAVMTTDTEDNNTAAAASVSLANESFTAQASWTN